MRRGCDVIFARSCQIFDRHTHDAYAFGYIYSGGQRWHSGRGQVEAKAGELIMSNPGEVHDGSPIGGESRTWCMLHVLPEVLHSAAKQLGFDRPNNYEFSSPVVHDVRLLQAMSRLIGVVTRETSSVLLYDELFLYMIAKLGDARLPRDSASCSRIGAARTILDDDPAQVHSLAELAAQCGLSQWQLLRSFAKETGFTPHAYQVQRRIELARKLISEGSGLAGASALSGFADQSHMTRTFRRKYGFSPRVWANSIRKKAAPVTADAISF